MTAVSTQLKTSWMAFLIPFGDILEDPTLVTFLPTIDTCLYGDGRVLRADFVLLISNFNFRPELHPLVDVETMIRATASFVFSILDQFYVRVEFEGNKLIDFIYAHLQNMKDDERTEKMVLCQHSKVFLRIVWDPGIIIGHDYQLEFSCVRLLEYKQSQERMYCNVPIFYC